ncbi:MULTISPECIES: alpha-amylase family glycosyl hydrolase [unclassified Algibacter]|uniref:alpha-amylase family glycosyl hydrolase n=1 Tax=unclassified Algibacter TaxID=2615009 RepID=UPI00131B20C8|nr:MULTISPECIES: alpha-amylase family glycosyl hydrolase [unclassified Algibacter]MCL5127332.1 alpha-amylase family glycosyl hydrolase [Algibacter sp. L4_22]
MKQILATIIVLFILTGCNKTVKTEVVKPEVKTPFVWEGANVYFLLTDRFNNADTVNDINFNRTAKTGKLRGFEGGDLKGVTQKINEGYFTNLGINAIWMTPIVEQIHGGTDEGTGLSYGYHGYWAKDWTSIDPNFGSKADLHELIKTAHKHGIRVLLDGVINHTGPVTDKDSVWPKEWVRTGPQCSYDNYENTVACTLVKNLPDLRTESNENIDLPPFLIKKWKTEGRYDQEIKELDAFFERTGHPRSPRFYVMKWLTDYIIEYGIDGYRVDTVKHTEAYVWQEYKAECDYAFAQYKEQNPEKVLDNNEFYLVGEVYNYNISNEKTYDFGDKKVNYFDNAFESLINFEAKWNLAQRLMEDVFKRYSGILNGGLKGYSVLNYLTSHDDGQPFDAKREKPFETATKLLLCPGASQVYYGDELARPLVIEGAEGDATLRSFMNWDDFKNNTKTQAILKHWQKLGQFRASHPAVGAGIHQMISQEPYLFTRRFSKEDFNDVVLVGLDFPKGEKIIDVSEVFENGIKIHDAYSGVYSEVKDGQVLINSNDTIMLLEKK